LTSSIFLVSVAFVDRGQAVDERRRPSLLVIIKFRNERLGKITSEPSLLGRLQFPRRDGCSSGSWSTSMEVPWLAEEGVRAQARAETGTGPRTTIGARAGVVMTTRTGVGARTQATEGAGEGARGQAREEASEVR